jgi:hypothetical protein
MIASDSRPLETAQQGIGGRRPIIAMFSVAGELQILTLKLLKRICGLSGRIIFRPLNGLQEMFKPQIIKYPKAKKHKISINGKSPIFTYNKFILLN